MKIAPRLPQHLVIEDLEITSVMIQTPEGQTQEGYQVRFLIQTPPGTQLPERWTDHLYFSGQRLEQTVAYLTAHMKDKGHLAKPGSGAPALQ